MTASFFDELGAAQPQWEVVAEPAHRPLPAIPEPSTTPLPALLDACTAVAVWAEQCDDVEEVREVYDRMAAVAAYLSRQDHAATAAATLRRLELRIGELVGPAAPNGRYDDGIPREVSALRANRVHEFRQMADHPEVVKEVIEDSTEESPASRRKVLAAIKNLEDVAKGETRRPEEPRRQPLPPQLSQAIAKLRQALAKVDELVADDRITPNRTLLAELVAGDLNHVIETCTSLAERLEIR